MKYTSTILILALAIFLPSCSSYNSSDKPLPVLTSPSRAQAWGSPKVTKTEDGYSLTYSNPSNDKESITIVGARKAMYQLYYPPNLIGTRTVNGIPTKIDEAQVWQRAMVAGRTVRLYQRFLSSSHHGSIFRTVGAELQNPTGGKGSYRIEIEGTKNQVQTWLSELRFTQE